MYNKLENSRVIMPLAYLIGNGQQESMLVIATSPQSAGAYYQKWLADNGRPADEPDGKPTTLTELQPGTVVLAPYLVACEPGRYMEHTEAYHKHEAYVEMINKE